MNDLIVIVGLAICAILVLIPIAMIGHLIYGIVSSYVEHRRAEARKTTAEVPRLGEFWSTDNRLWFGEVRNVQVVIETEGGPPSETHASRTLALLDDLPQLADRAKHYVLERKDVSWLTDGVEEFEVSGIELESDAGFALELDHPADPDGMYRVVFREGVPVSSDRDD